MKISIITATYNSAATIQDTLESIKYQKYNNIEHIIIDGASKDNTLNIVKTYSHVAKVISEPDKGIYDAMNKGIHAATGDIIGILNSDDFYTSTHTISNVATHLYKSQTDTLYADLQYVDDMNTNKITRTWYADAFDKDNFLTGWMPPHPTFFVRKEVYEKYGLFDLRLHSSADYELMLRFLFKYRVSTCYLPEVIVNMRTGGQSTYSLKNRLNANQEDKLAWEFNNLTPRFYTTYLKPLRKISQFLVL
jgi:glycosyltransferase involved in cell wall biosynthesis